MNFNTLFNELASLEHTRWGDWQRHLHSLGQRIKMLNPRPLEDDEIFVLPISTIQRWDALIDTPYASLSTKSRASDLEQVARYWPVIVDAVYDWIWDNGDRELADQWAEDAKWPAANRDDLEILSADLPQKPRPALIAEEALLCGDYVAVNPQTGRVRRALQTDPQPFQITQHYKPGEQVR